MKHTASGYTAFAYGTYLGLVIKYLSLYRMNDLFFWTFKSMYFNLKMNCNVETQIRRCGEPKQVRDKVDNCDEGAHQIKGQDFVSWKFFKFNKTIFNRFHIET